MTHQNIQFIKILDAKINQGKNKTFLHNESLYIQHLTKIQQGLPHLSLSRQTICFIVLL